MFVGKPHKGCFQTFYAYFHDSSEKGLHFAHLQIYIKSRFPFSTSDSRKNEYLLHLNQNHHPHHHQLPFWWWPLDFVIWTQIYMKNWHGSEHWRLLATGKNVEWFLRMSSVSVPTRLSLSTPQSYGWGNLKNAESFLLATVNRQRAICDTVKSQEKVEEMKEKKTEVIEEEEKEKRERENLFKCRTQDR